MGCGTGALLSLLLPPPPSELNESQRAEKMRDMQKEPSWLVRHAGEQGRAHQGECAGAKWNTLEGGRGHSWSFHGDGWQWAGEECLGPDHTHCT